MKKKLTPAFFRPASLYFLPFVFLWSVIFFPTDILASSNSRPSPFLPRAFPTKDFGRMYHDTVKYQGYRLDLTDFKVLKTTDQWVKIQFTVVNSGRKDVDFSKKGTEHWVQINFDQSLFDHKLGGLRENIRHALYQENFSLAVGQIRRNKDLKVPVVLPASQQTQTETGISFSERKPSQEEQPVLMAKGGGEDVLPAQESWLKKTEECPDILFTNLKIIEQDDKWATLEYTIQNQGKGDFHLFGVGEGAEKLAIRAYISGAPVLSRGALPIGGQFVQAASGFSPDLRPGQSITGKVRLDIRKKTRYMKSLILSLESDQFSHECDKTNNSRAVILD